MPALETNVSSPELKEYTLDNVLWREYDFAGRVYRIDRPVCFWHRAGGETHRVMDGQGVVHIVPAPGVNGCVLRYAKEHGEHPCKF